MIDPRQRPTINDVVDRVTEIAEAKSIDVGAPLKLDGMVPARPPQQPALAAARPPGTARPFACSLFRPVAWALHACTKWHPAL